ncbi:hypothetical protein Vi05172_g12768 [Venturia inaequalis]|nr:hypothetical protein Vi05172_g12768 [Venturia inaequalis]
MSSSPPPSTTSKTYSGSCHCRTNTFTVPISPPLEDPSTTVLNCNCSICAKNGSLLVFVPAASINWIKGGPTVLIPYLFNKKIVNHSFCPTCGNSFVAQMGDTVGLNVRSLDGIDIDSLKRKDYDGKST